MHQSKRIAASSFVTSGLLMVAALGSVVSSEDVASQALDGTGLGALCTAGLGLAIIDAAVKQFDSEDGSSRMPMVLLGLLGLFWGMVRIGLGDPWIIPAVSGLLWLTMQAAFFTQPVDDEEDEPVTADSGPTDAAG